MHPPVPITAAFLILAYTARYDLRKDSERPQGQPYERYFTHDRFGRQITFYVTEATGKEPAPLVVFVQGSGGGSNFIQLDVTFDRIAGANHSFMSPDDKTGKGWTEEMKRVLDWFLSSSM